MTVLAIIAIAVSMFGMGFAAASLVKTTAIERQYSRYLPLLKRMEYGDNLYQAHLHQVYERS